jgi:hypothetical protein
VGRNRCGDKPRGSPPYHRSVVIVVDRDTARIVVDRYRAVPADQS